MCLWINTTHLLLLHWGATQMCKLVIHSNFCISHVIRQKEHKKKTWKYFWKLQTTSQKNWLWSGKIQKWVWNGIAKIATVSVCKLQIARCQCNAGMVFDASSLAIHLFSPVSMFSELWPEEPTIQLWSANDCKISQKRIIQDKYSLSLHILPKRVGGHICIHVLYGIQSSSILKSCQGMRQSKRLLPFPWGTSGK